MKPTTKLALSMLILSSLYFASFRPCVEREFLYPVKYKCIVLKEAENEKIEPSLVASVILVESKYKIHATSEPGAKGLMQIMPETAKYIQEIRGQEDFKVEDLHDPEENIKIGTWYLAHLLKKYEGNEFLALSAYNAGEGNVDEWKKENAWDNKFSDISKIPFTETKAYVAKVLKVQKKYKELYDEED